MQRISNTKCFGFEQTSTLVVFIYDFGLSLSNLHYFASIPKELSHFATAPFRLKTQKMASVKFM